jgi:DNA-directed RNA polymerase subunit RPC12/RpoP
MHMAFEFSCSHCGKKISVPEGTWGRLAKCPYCDGQMTIPTPAPLVVPASPIIESPNVLDSSTPGLATGTSDVTSAGAPSPIAPRFASSSERPGNAGNDNTGQHHAGNYHAGNNYAGNDGPSMMPSRWPQAGTVPHASVRRRPINPALFVIAGFFLALSGILGLGTLAAEVWFFNTPVGQEALENATDQASTDPNINREQMKSAVLVILGLYASFAALASLLATIGGIQLARRRTRWLALAGAVCGLVPTHPCMIVLAWPIAIVAFIVVLIHRDMFD